LEIDIFFALPMVHYFLRASILGVYEVISERFQSAQNGVFIAFLEELDNSGKWWEWLMRVNLWWEVNVFTWHPMQLVESSHVVASRTRNCHASVAEVLCTYPVCSSKS
jgi:hypothetical protein